MSQIVRDYRPSPEYLIWKYISNIKFNENDDDDKDTIITNYVININYSDDDVIQIKVNDKENFESIPLLKKDENTSIENKSSETVKLISDEDYNKYKQLFDKFEKGFNIIENIKKWCKNIFNFFKKFFIKA